MKKKTQYRIKQSSGQKPKAKQILPTEGEEQRMLFEWIELKKRKYPELGLCFHIPNGGSRNLLEAHNLKTQGVKAGVPDLFLPVPSGSWHGLFIELKRQKGGRVSDKQRQWLTDLEKEGYRAELAFGWKDASEIILNYLNGR